MKYLVLLAILAVVLTLFFGSKRRMKPPAPPPAPPPAQPPAPKAPEAAQMLACAHCGVHLPRGEASFDVAGRPFCSPEHRVGGPR